MRGFSKMFSGRLRAVLAVTLVFSLVAAPMTAIAAEINAQYENIGIVDAHVEEMLAKGPYIEGQAIAIMFKSDIPKNGYLGVAEEVMDTTKESYEITTGEQLNNFKVTDEVEDLAIILVEDDSLTTEELLRRLLRDSRIISAEPNYVTSAIEPDEGDINVPVNTDTGAKAGAATNSDAKAATPSDEETASPSENETEEYEDGILIDDVKASFDRDEDESSEDELEDISFSYKSLTKERYYSSNYAIKSAGTNGATKGWWDEADLSKKLATSSTPNLTSHQWYVNRSAGKAFTIYDAAASAGDSDINLEGWKETPAEDHINSSGVVVVMDEGVDYTHKDLAGVMYGNTAAGEAKMDDFIAEYHLGNKYGYNPQDPDNINDPMPVNEYDKWQIKTSHGTHVAGLIASKWDEGGTSGVANGVDIISVAVMGTGKFSGTTYSLLKGFAYVSKLVDFGIDVKTINLSIGGTDPSDSATIAAARLGEKGVVTLFAAGNDRMNLDTEVDDAGAHMKSPYTVVVGASQVGGFFDNTYSNYGSAVSFFAPGTADLSTITTESSYTNGTFFPAKDGSDVFYNALDGSGDIGSTAAKKKVDFFKMGWTCATPSEDYKYNDQIGYEASGSSFEIDPSRFIDQDGDVSMYVGLYLGSESVNSVKQEGGRDYIDIENGNYPLYNALTDPNGDAAANFVSFTWGSGQLSNRGLWAFPLMFKPGMGATIDNSYISGDYEQNGIKDAINLYGQTEYATINLHKAVAGAKYGNSDFSSAVSAEIDDENNVNYYIYLRLTTDVEDVPLYLDTFGVGAKNTPYQFMDGTSMATPVATGLLSVIYEESNADPGFTELSKGQQALYVIDKMKRSVTQTADMTGNCQTNGRLNAAKPAAVHPVVTKVSLSQDGAYDIIVEGNHFGNQKAASDSVTLTGFEINGHTGTPIDLKVKSWTDTVIICEKPAQIRSAVYNISVKAGDAKANLSASLKFSDADVYENDINAPSALTDVFNLDLKTFETDFRTTVGYSAMTVADGKLFMLPYSYGGLDSSYGLVKYLWMYDPSLGTGENAFKRVVDVADAFGWESLIGTEMTTVDNQIYIVSSIDNGKDKDQTNAFLKVDPTTMKTERIPFPKSLETSDYGFVCTSGDYVVIPSIPSKNAEKGLTGRNMSIYAYNVKTKAYTEELTLKLPNGYINNGKTMTVRIHNGRLYVLGEFAIDEKCKNYAVKFLEYKFSINDNMIGLAFNRELELPQRLTSGRASFALEVLAEGPAIVALSNTTGQDYGYDTFLYKYGETGYSKYSRKASLGNVWSSSVAAGNDTMYVAGFDYFNKNCNFILRSTKINTIDHKDPTPEPTPDPIRPSGGSGGSYIAGSSLPAYVAKSGSWEQGADGTWKFKGAVNLTGTNGYNKTDANGYFVDTWAAIADSTYSKSGTSYRWFKFDKNGNMLTGWFTDTDGRVYYLNPKSDGTKGAMMTGWVTIDGKEYYFNESSDGTKGALVPDKKK